MATVGLTAVDSAYAGLAFVSFLLSSLVVLDGFHPPPGCELQFVHGLRMFSTQVSEFLFLLDHKDIQLKH